jgi:hypothetical protein
MKCLNLFVVIYCMVLKISQNIDLFHFLSILQFYYGDVYCYCEIGFAILSLLIMNESKNVYIKNMKKPL